MDEFNNEPQIPVARANFMNGLVVIRNDVEWLAEKLAKTMDTPDKLDALVMELQKHYEELRNSNPKLWDDEVISDRQ